jgi:hypothetical protein
MNDGGPATKRRGTDRVGVEKGKVAVELGVLNRHQGRENREIYIYMGEASVGISEERR